MLEEYYAEVRALMRAKRSPSGPYLDDYACRLKEAGYAQVTIQEFLRAATHVGLWLERQGAPIQALDESAIGRFRSHLPSCTCPGPRPQRRRHDRIAVQAARFLEQLRQAGVVAKAPPMAGKDVHPLLAGFEVWMRQHRGPMPETLRSYRRVITDALSVIGDDPAAFSAPALRKFVLSRSRLHGRSYAKQVMTAMRVFLRYLAASGACHSGLEGAIPTVAGWRLASLPRYLSPSDIDRVIATCDPLTPIGSRNRAILLLLARLGLRAKDVAMLRLVDIDWHHATLQVAGKSRRTARLPLPQEIGDAILAYLPGRATVSGTDHVFLRLVPPWGPLASGSIASVARRAMRLAQVVAPAGGAHVLRHSAAAGLLRQGASLDVVRFVLRHRDPETTMLYAKVDLTLLRRVAQPWPEVTPC